MANDESLDLLRRRVVNVIGHELRTPVTIVRGLSESLAVSRDASTREALIAALARSSARLEALVDDLLLAAGVATAVPVGDAASVDGAVAVRDAGWSGPIEGRGAVWARPASVRLILEKIVENATKHGADPFTCSVDDGTIEIRNGGVELPPGDAELATEAFYRGEQAVMTTHGLGLGLSIARTVARAEGGDVEVRRRDGGGVVVTVTLPAAAA